MNKDAFWNIIDEVNQACPSRDQESIIAVVTEKLMKLDINEILDFHLIQKEYFRAAYRNDLHAASEAMGAAPSNNGMQAFLYWLISSGKEVFIKAMNDPDTLADVPREGEKIEFLSFGYAAYTAYSMKMDRICPGDILLDFSGEGNPRRECSYGLTDAGKQALQNAADPSLPHTYAWFVMTDCNTPQETIHRDLTLEEAVQLYQNSDRPEKRIGVTKDGIATVDIVHMADGEQQFFEDHRRLDSFRSDPVVAKAAALLQHQLDQPDAGQDLIMGGI